MHITLDLDDDVIEAAMAIATREQKTLDAILSQLARSGLRERDIQAAPISKVRHGFRVLPRRGEVVTVDHVRCLLDEEGV